MENPGGECHGHGGTNKLERLSQCDSDLLDRDVIQNVGKRNADDSRKDENQVRLWTRMNRRTDFAKHERKGQQQARSDEADNSKAADRSELSGGPFDQNTIQRPTKRRGESDEQSGQCNMPRRRSGLRVGLKPDHSERSDQPQ